MSWGWTQVIRLVGKHLYILNHFAAFSVLFTSSFILDSVGEPYSYLDFALRDQNLVSLRISSICQIRIYLYSNNTTDFCVHKSLEVQNARIIERTVF